MYYIVGNDEDGGFVREAENIEELNEFLQSMTDGSHDEIDLDSLGMSDGDYRIETTHYWSDHYTFSVIRGDAVKLKAKEVVTKVDVK